MILVHEPLQQFYLAEWILNVITDVTKAVLIDADNINCISKWIESSLSWTECDILLSAVWVFFAGNSWQYSSEWNVIIFDKNGIKKPACRELVNVHNFTSFYSKVNTLNWHTIDSVKSRFDYL